jgi:hypothetical protein
MYITVEEYETKLKLSSVCDYFCAMQGGQIGRISAQSAIVFFSSFLKMTRVVHIFALLFTRKMFCINFDKKMFGLHFGRFFLKLIWSPWPLESYPMIRAKLNYATVKF